MSVFVDTVYLLALINPNDFWHEKALEWARRISEPLVTTEAVLTEVADALSHRDRRKWAIDAIRDLRSDPQVAVTPGSADLFLRGFELYASRHDKDWSLTDCMSFVAMRDLGIDRALTADIHFAQAGFKSLLRE
jgi:uncharacterized protein